ncbi:nucleoprotein TPR [Microcaecilia unicolor]|uniref:Nucleoprotein TPR n=1 Tax=Microcaecilia unicolor TaxID=1415580 RepID=A0A6P7WVN2_9AMPH|nr:nucleoprotein TPR [Microcaecilia unicolor]
MSYRSCGGYYSLPSRYSGNGCIQYSSNSGRRSPCWTSNDLGSSRGGFEILRPIPSDLGRSCDEGLLSSQASFRAKNSLKFATGQADPNYSNSQCREYSWGSLSPRQSSRPRSTSPLRGIHCFESGSALTNGADCSGRCSSPPMRRRHSLSRLPSWSREETDCVQSLARRKWSGSDLDLRASLSDSAQKRADLVNQLREAHSKLQGQSKELKKRDKELELSRAKLEMLSLKQKKLEGSVAHLEKEKEWLELSRSEEKTQRGELQEKIINLEMEVVKAKSCLDTLSHSSLSLLPSWGPSMGKDDFNQELNAVREHLHYYRDRVKVLERERNEAIQQLKVVKKGQEMVISQTNKANQSFTSSLQTYRDLHDELCDLRMSYSSMSVEKELLSSKVLKLKEMVADLSMKLKAAVSDRERLLQEKVDLHQQVQELSLQLEHAQRGKEGFSDQMSDLHVELVDAKAQANRQDQETVQMKEELLMVKAVNEKLSSELSQSSQKLEASLEQLHHLEAEKKIFTNQIAALETERTQLLGEKEVLMSAMEGDAKSQEDSMQAVHDSSRKLWALQEEKQALQTRCVELETTLQQMQDTPSQLQEEQQVSQYWKDRWQQAAVNLKTKEDELEKAQLQYQSVSAKHTELLEDCEMLQADVEELSELRTVVQSLKEENGDLMRRLGEHHQITRLLQLQSDVAANSDMDSKMLTTELEALHKEMRQTHTRMKELEMEKSTLETQLRKLKLENGSVLQIELDACKQELELERSRSASLQHETQMLQSKNWSNPGAAGMGIDLSPSALERSGPKGKQSEVKKLQHQLETEKASQKEKESVILTLTEELEDMKCKKPGDIKASLEEVDTELVVVREELQKVWDMLKTRDSELEEQQQELESARDQYTECSTEKQRLEQLVTSLSEQLAEKNQNLRHLGQLKEMEKTEMDIKHSSLELKLAEIEVSKETKSAETKCHVVPWSPQRVGRQEKQATVSQKKCSRCETFLEQLDKKIQDCTGKNVERQEEQNQVLSVLYQLQELLKGLTKRVDLDARVTQSLQTDNERMKRQHQLVTEQLKSLFKEKQQLTKAYNRLPSKQKRESSTEEWMKKSRVVKNVLEAIKSQEKEQEELQEERQRLQESLELQSTVDEREVQNLRLQLGERMEMISSMASEIKMLREKNESLMKAKLRFQQQIQNIQSLSQQGRRRTVADPSIPRLCSSSDTESVQTCQSYESESSTSGCKDSSLPTRESLYLEKQVPVSETKVSQHSLLPEGAHLFKNSPEESETVSEVPTPGSSRSTTPPHMRALSPLLRLNLPTLPAKSWKKTSSDTSPLSPRSQSGSDGSWETQTSLTPKCSVLLSPRPFQPQKQESAFKFGEKPESPRN